MIEQTLLETLKYITIIVVSSGVTTYCFSKFRDNYSSKKKEKRKGTRVLDDIVLPQYEKERQNEAYCQHESSITNAMSKHETKGDIGRENIDLTNAEKNESSSSLEEIVPSSEDEVLATMFDMMKGAFEKLANKVSTQLSDFLHERAVDLEIRLEENDLMSMGLFLIDLYDELKHKMDLASDLDSECLKELIDNIDSVLTTAGFEIFCLPTWDKTKQKILSVERNSTEAGIRILSTEESGLLYKGRLVRKQGVCIITNKSEA